jgi:diaminohydroxyphosphoribosylaminopyrimidine deaminase/5-amino-6-(5-phosphoribosylamino)uracil reductase
VARVVVGTVDPNPRVHGQGIAALRAAGVEVVLAAGRLAAQCRALIAPFAATMTAGRAYVVLKVAASLDGLTATRTGASLYITGPQSRGLVHALRDACDGVVVGAGTVIHDDPALTVRDHRRRDGSATRDPRRVVLDRQAQVPLTARVLDPPGALLVHGAHTTPKPLVGVETLALTAEPHLDLSALAEALPGHGVSSALIEAGPRLAAAFVSAGLVDELWWFRAPLLVGGDGQRAIASLGVDALAAAARFRPVHAQRVGDDDLVILRPVS